MLALQAAAGEWSEVALAAVNVVQVVLLSWIASNVSAAKNNREWRDRREDEERRDHEAGL
jgi:hypothetical protein